MPAPSGRPYIKTIYKNDGSIQKEAVGFGGRLCEVATAPYMARHGNKYTSIPTEEASQPSYLELENEGGEKASV